MERYYLRFQKVDQLSGKDASPRAVEKHERQLCTMRGKKQLFSQQWRVIAKKEATWEEDIPKVVLQDVRKVAASLANNTGADFVCDESTLDAFAEMYNMQCCWFDFLQTDFPLLGDASQPLNLPFFRDQQA